MSEEKQKKSRFLVFAFFSLIAAMFAGVSIYLGLIGYAGGVTVWNIMFSSLKIMGIPIVMAIGIFAGYYFLVFKKED